MSSRMAGSTLSLLCLKRTWLIFHALIPEALRRLWLSCRVFMSILQVKEQSKKASSGKDCLPRLQWSEIIQDFLLFPTGLPPHLQIGILTIRIWLKWKLHSQHRAIRERESRRGKGIRHPLPCHIRVTITPHSCYLEHKSKHFSCNLTRRLALRETN